MKFSFGVDALELFPREALLRLLTLAFFFQFAGFQNGWVRQASLAGSVDVPQAVRSAGAPVLDLYLNVHPAQIGQSIQIFSASFARWVESNAIQARPETVRPENSVFANEAQSIVTADHQISIIREDWLRQDGPRESFQSATSFLAPSKERSVSADDQRTLVQIREAGHAASKINKKKGGPRIVYAANDGADSGLLFNTSVFIG